MGFDFSPLFRTGIGFDRLVHQASAAQDISYPPYNIEKVADDQYRLTMAVAGFRHDDLEITVRENTLLVIGRTPAEAGNAELLYRGIAGRAFERRFALADHLVVERANLANGLLHIQLRRIVPEALKPRRISIGVAAPTLDQATVKAA